MALVDSLKQYFGLITFKSLTRHVASGALPQKELVEKLHTLHQCFSPIVSLFFKFLNYYFCRNFTKVGKISERSNL